jgi:hypothetical protein
MINWSQIDNSKYSDFELMLLGREMMEERFREKHPLILTVSQSLNCFSLSLILMNVG